MISAGQDRRAGAVGVGRVVGQTQDFVERAVPNGEEWLLTGAAFQPGLPAPAGSSTLDQILLLLGRSPGWPG